MVIRAWVFDINVFKKFSELVISGKTRHSSEHETWFSHSVKQETNKLAGSMDTKCSGLKDELAPVSSHLPSI